MERLAHVEQFDVESFIGITTSDNVRHFAQKWFYDGKIDVFRRFSSFRFFQVTTSDDGTKKIQGQVICRVPAGNESSASENDARFLAYVVQVNENFDEKKNI